VVVVVVVCSGGTAGAAAAVVLVLVVAGAAVATVVVVPPGGGAGGAAVIFASLAVDPEELPIQYPMTAVYPPPTIPSTTSPASEGAPACVSTSTATIRNTITPTTLTTTRPQVLTTASRELSTETGGVVIVVPDILPYPQPVHARHRQQKTDRDEQYDQQKQNDSDLFEWIGKGKQRQDVIDYTSNYAQDNQVDE
jgi:hypothetical protein